MEAERPIIVDRSGRHLIWDGSSHSWVDANQDESQREQYNGWPESMSGEDPARDTEIASNPRSFGTFGAIQEHGYEEPSTQNYDRTGEQGFDPMQVERCENCKAELDGDGDCNNCGMSQYDPGGRLYQGTGQNGDGFGSGFPDVVPKMNYMKQWDGGASSSVHEAMDFGAPAPPGGLDFGAPAVPGQEGAGAKHETHRFVIDKAGDTYLEPATMEHADIVAKHGLDEAARGSIYNDNTADVHRSWVPLDRGQVERDLGHHMGQFSIPINYMPGDSTGASEGMGAKGVPIKGVKGYIWKQEQGIPNPQLAARVPLIFAAEHSTPDDFPAYQHAKGFLTATGGATSHAVVEGRQRSMGGAVGIGPDYSKVQHGAPVSIEDDGSVTLGHYDPTSTIADYFNRTDQDWQNAELERRRREWEFKKRVPEWQRPNRGGSVVFDKSQDELAIEAMTFGPRIAANLDECPECGDVMVERPEGKVCANCGHTQKIIQMDASTRESWSLNPIKDVGQAVGDAAGIAGKGVDFAKEHPWETAGLLGAGALAVGTGGLAVPLEAGIAGGALEGGGLAAGELGAGAALEGGAGAAAAEGAGVAGAEGAAAGEGAAAAEGGAAGEAGAEGGAQAPGRVKTLMNGAKSMGKGYLINQGIQSVLGQGGGQGGGGQVQDYQGLVASVDPRFDMWQYAVTAAEDDPDGLQQGGTSNDGDDVDPAEAMTQGNQQETGGDLEGLLKSLADDGSANQGPYSDDQKGALDHFNKNLPVIVELALDDEHDHSDHPVIQELEALLKGAFPGDDFGGDHHDEHHEPEHHGDEDDAHEPEVKEEAHEADKDEPKVSAAHPDGCDCGFCKNMRKNQGVDEDDGDDDVKESSWVVAQEATDMSESDVEAIFAGEPVLELVDRVGGVFSAMPFGPSGKGPKETEIDEEGEDEEERKRKAAVELLVSAGYKVAKPAEHNPEVNKAHEGESSEEEGEDEEEAEEGKSRQGKTAGPGDRQQSDPVTPQRVLPGPDSAVDKGKPITTIDGQPLEEGKSYLMSGQGYSVPDEIRIEKLKPNPVSPTHVEVTINTGGISFPNVISLEDIHSDGLQFKPVSQADHAEVQNAEQGAQPDSTPDANEQTDMSTPTMNVAHDDPTAEELEAEPIQEPVDGLIYTDQKTGEPISYMEYAASLRSSAPPELAWLWDNVKADVEMTDREASIMQMTAGKNFTTQEQREFINEPGEARNKDKLDLDGTHYIYDDDDADELWFN